jgi:DNA replication protein DnaD
MSNPNQFFTVTEQYKEKFYQLPKVFFTNPNYLDLSNDAKIAYAILRDRLELSIKNNWIDNDNIIYFIYTNENLENILNVSKPKVIKIKKELEKVELLKQKRLGLNKPNMLYLMKPNVTDCDIYKIKNSETLPETSSDAEVKNINFQKSNSLTSGNKDSLLQEVKDINTNDTELSDTDFINTELNETTTTKNSKTSSKINSGSGIEKNQFIQKLEKELNIQMNDIYKRQLIKYTKEFKTNEFNHMLDYAIELSAIQGNNPKQYLLKILENWQKADIQTLEQAKNYTQLRQNKKIVQNKEMTPKWLLERDNENVQKEKDVHEIDEQHEKERIAFLQHLKERWGDDN